MSKLTQFFAVVTLTFLSANVMAGNSDCDFGISKQQNIALFCRDNPNNALCALFPH